MLGAAAFLGTCGENSVDLPITSLQRADPLFRAAVVRFQTRGAWLAALSIVVLPYHAPLPRIFIFVFLSWILLVYAFVWVLAIGIVWPCVGAPVSYTHLTLPTIYSV